jgi:hypothetical protein
MTPPPPSREAAPADTPLLCHLLDHARAYQPTAAEREAQRQSFARGNVTMSQTEEQKTVTEAPADGLCPWTAGEGMFEGDPVFEQVTRNTKERRRQMNTEPSPAGPTTIPEATEAEALIRRVEEYERMATEGPWYDDGYRVHAPTDDDDKRSGDVLLEYKHLDHGSSFNGEFAAFARTDLPRAVALLRDALDALARERRRTASLLEAGEYLRESFDAMQSDGTFLPPYAFRAVRFWEKAKDALAGPGGDETAGVT